MVMLCEALQKSGSSLALHGLAASLRDNHSCPMAAQWILPIAKMADAR